MKMRFLLFMLLCTVLTWPLFTSTSCSSAKHLAAFDVIYTFPKVYFSYGKKSEKLPEVTLYTGKLSVNMDSILSASHIPSGIIASAFLSRMAMVITAPPQATFKWLKSVRIIGCIDSTFQQTTELAYDTAVNPNATRIDLALNKTDIKPIFFKNSYYLRILATPSGQLPDSTMSLYLDSQIKLHIEPL
jgi:hypothetical protein